MICDYYEANDYKALDDMLQDWNGLSYFNSFKDKAKIQLSFIKQGSIGLELMLLPVLWRELLDFF